MSKNNRKKNIIKAQGSKCAYCGSIQDLTIDHIIPQSVCLAFGVDRNRRENLQTLCQPYNNKKGNSLKSNDPKTVRLVIQMVEEWKFLHLPPSVSPRKYVFKNLPVRSLTPNTTYFWTGSSKQAKEDELQKIYIKQKLGLK